MNPLLRKLLAPRNEYLTLDKNLIILEASVGAQRFADCPADLSLGQDVRIPFPELIGVEETLIEILEGRQISFELKGIARSDTQTLAFAPASPVSQAVASFRLQSLCLQGVVHENSFSRADPEELVEASGTGVQPARLAPSSPLYFDLYISEYYDQEAGENRLIVFLEDATQRMVSQQILAQRANEASLLLSALTASKNYIDRVIASMTDVLVVTTASGIIKTVNQSAQDLFGYTEEELISKPVSLIITEDDFLQKINHLSASVPGEFLKDVEAICQTKTGEKIPVAFSCSAIETEIEGLQNFVYIGRDITERKRVEAEMIKALERERELRELKSCFVSMASHEFRTPMTSIVSSTELVEYYGHTWTEDKKLKHYHRIKGAVKRMTELLDDVLLFSKAEAGKLEFNPTPLVLKNFCSDLVEEIQLGIGEKHKITFVYSGPCLNLCMDEKLLLHILTNLLTNAIKYSPQNTIVHFGCYCEDGEVIFEIQDQGIGIPLEDQKQLFESFHRAKNVGSIPGTGLGLAIVQKSVERHRGRITVNSEVGVGTTFKVILPLNNESKTR
jgi:PAS domain S-box-containing protein